MAREGNLLVCQYLENVSRKALEKYQDIVKQYSGPDTRTIKSSLHRF